MYSYDDRMRAVQLYLKLGKRFRATIRQLGAGRLDFAGWRAIMSASHKPWPDCITSPLPVSCSVKPFLYSLQFHFRL